MKLNTDSQPSEAEVDAMKRKIQQRYQNVDPDQYIRALQKVANKATTAADAKPSDKQQSQPAPATTTQSDKPKPQP